jgi:hypothetical protein
VLIDSITAGIPSAYVDGLDHSSPDLHRFVAAGLIYQSEVNPDLEEVRRFYQQPGWCQTLRTFANIDENESAVLGRALSVITDMRSPSDR